MPPDAILDCFISGLKPEIQNELAIIQPTSISQAIGLAKLVESKIQATRPLTTHFLRPTPPKPSPPLLSPPPPRLALPAPPNSKYPIKYLSPTEMQARKTQGLCFYCDEKFHKGHHCRSRQFLLLLNTDDTNQPLDIFHEDLYCLAEMESLPPPFPTSLLPAQPSNNSPDSTNLPFDNFHLSLQAATRQLSLKTLRFPASIKGHFVSILVDTGSSHNIIQPRITHFLSLPIHFISPCDGG